MKYKSLITIDDIDILTDLGYIDNKWGNISDPIRVEYGIFEACKAFPSKFSNSGVNVAITYNGQNSMIDIYKYRGEPSRHKRISTARNKKQYIQDLIDRGLVILE